MAKQNVYKAMFLYGYFIVSQSQLRWDIKKTPVIYGQDASLSCNGIGCNPVSIRKWIGGPTDDVLCFNEYSSNPEKYQLMYNKTKPSFDLIIKSFVFTDTNCTYTCACGFYQFTSILKLEEIDFVYPPDKNLTYKTKQEDGKWYLNMSMKVHPLPNCTILYGNTILPVMTNITNVQEVVGIKLYGLNINYILNVGTKYCKVNLSLSCQVNSFNFQLLQQKLHLCKDHVDDPDVVGTLFGIFIGVTCLGMISCLVIYVRRRRRTRRKKRISSRYHPNYGMTLLYQDEIIDIT